MSTSAIKHTMKTAPTAEKPAQNFALHMFFLLFLVFNFDSLWELSIALYDRMRAVGKYITFVLGLGDSK